MQISINFFEDEQVCDFNIEKLFKLILDQTLEILKVTDNRLVDVSFVSQTEIRSINKQYRKLDKVTDVISYNYDETVRNEFILGEMYICWQQAIKQAKTYQHSLKREVCFLFTHGLLHLFGYNHIIEDDAKIMFALQEQILSKCKLEREI